MRDKQIPVDATSSQGQPRPPGPLGLMDLPAEVLKNIVQYVSAISFHDSSLKALDMTYAVLRFCERISSSYREYPSNSSYWPVPRSIRICTFALLLQIQRTLTLQPPGFLMLCKPSLQVITIMHSTSDISRLASPKRTQQMRS